MTTFSCGEYEDVLNDQAATVWQALTSDFVRRVSTHVQQSDAMHQFKTHDVLIICGRCSMFYGWVEYVDIEREWIDI